MPDASTPLMVPVVMTRLSSTARLIIRRERRICIAPLPAGRGFVRFFTMALTWHRLG
jgi:hypothetical protein